MVKEYALFRTDVIQVAIFQISQIKLPLTACFYKIYWVQVNLFQYGLIIRFSYYNFMVATTFKENMSLEILNFLNFLSFPE